MAFQCVCCMFFQQEGPLTIYYTTSSSSSSHDDSREGSAQKYPDTFDDSDLSTKYTSIFEIDTESGRDRNKSVQVVRGNDSPSFESDGSVSYATSYTYTTGYRTDPSSSDNKYQSSYDSYTFAFSCTAVLGQKGIPLM